MYCPVMGTGSRPLFCAKEPLSLRSSEVSHDCVDVFVVLLVLVVVDVFVLEDLLELFLLLAA